MTRRSWLRYFVVVPLLLATVACFGDTGDLTSAAIEDSVIEFLGGGSGDLSNDPDPRNRAAGQSDKAVDRARAAEKDVEVTADDILSVLDKLDLGEDAASGGATGPDSSDSEVTADEIMNLEVNLPLRPDPAEDQSVLPPIATPAQAREDVQGDPRNASLHLTQAVAEVAAGESPADAKGRAFLLNQLLDTTGEPEKEYLGSYLIQLTFGLHSAKERGGRDDVFDRLLTEYCAQARLWERDYPSTPLGIANVDALNFYETEPACSS